MSKTISVSLCDSVVSILPYFLLALFASPAFAQTGTLQNVLQQVDAQRLASEARLRGDARRGAIVFHNSAAACVKCHQSGDGKSPLGPDLAQLGDKITDIHLVESLLHPSKSIREGFQTVQLLTTNGQLISGMLVQENDQNIVVRDAENLQSEITIAKDDIEDRSNSKLSMMPVGLVSSLKSEREFLDLLSYLFAIQAGGSERAEELRPSPEQLVVKDDTVNLNHAKIIRQVEDGKLKRGQQIYEASCIQCHGADGNMPSLATARAFGKQKLKFGADTYSMFKTLSHGNGLMAAASALSPHERYEVVAYIRNRFMKNSNPDYQAITDEYLQSLPKGSEMGEFEPAPDRDYGPAGLNGWNDNGRAGLADGGIYRVRHTGKPVRMITSCEVHPSEMRITFNFALDPIAATNVASFEALQWNYKWTGNYGSDAYHPETGDVGKQQVSITGAKLSDDGKTLILQVPKLRPVDQLHLRLQLIDTLREPFGEEIYWTIHAIPKQ